MSQQEATAKLTGVWARTGRYGEFYSSPNVTKAKVLELLEACPGEEVQIVVDTAQQTNDKSPAYNIKIKPGFVKTQG